MKILFSTVVFIFLTNQLYSQLSIKNGSSEPITVAIGWYSESEEYTGFVTKGWYNIEPGHTIDPGLYFTSNDDYFYYYAFSKSWEWKGGGDYKLLIHSTDAFTIKNAHLDYVKNENSSYQWRNFKLKEVHFDWLEERKHTLTLE
jgi:hypothetical protein